jgi:S1-C subfamily serine protease
MARGVRIVEVIPDSPAERAGLEAGQVITAADGKPLSGVKGFLVALEGFEPGDWVELTVLDADETEHAVTVTLGENPDQAGAAWLGIRFAPAIRVHPQGEMPWMPEGGGGTLPDLPRRFDIFPEGELPDVENMRPGAFIREVVAGSPAEDAGLRAGQVIQTVDGEAVDGPNVLPKLIAGYEPGDTVTLTVSDPGAQGEQAREIEVTLGEDPDQPGAAWLGIHFVYLKIQRFENERLPEG